MAMSRYREHSPGSRRLADPMRSSTGTVFSSGFDPYYPPPRNSVGSFATPRRPPVLEAQPISTRTYQGQGGAGTKSKTEYAIKPRRGTLEQDTVPPPRRPLSMAGPQPSARPRPVITSTVDRPRSPAGKPTYPRDDSHPYILPASKPHRHHKRIFSADGEDVHRLSATQRGEKDSAERGGYRSSGVGGQRSYPVQAPLVRYQGPTDYDDYSYTNPREQFDRDYPAPRPRPRTDSYTRRDRPMSMANIEDALPPVQSRRDPGPPPLSRGLEKLPRMDEPRANGRSAPGSDYSRSSEARTSESSRSSDMPQRRLSKKGPVSLHQDRDEGYSSYREGHDEPRDRHYRKERYDEDRKPPSDRHHDSRDDRRHAKSHDDHRERSGLGGGIAAAGIAAGGLAAAGLASSLKDSRNQDYDPDEVARRERKERRRREATERDHDAEAVNRDRRSDKPRDREIDPRDEPTLLRDRRRDRDGKGGSDSSDDHAREHERHRRRHHKDRKARDEESDAGSDLRTPVLPQGAQRDPRVRVAEPEDSEIGERHRRRRDRVLSDDEAYAETPAGTDDERPRAIPLVEPTAKEPEAAPKGILKAPKEKFPEDPSAVREGVAPLKDAGKKGVPSGARWTKISRNLVNPAALEDAHERFEERPDYVIVLRVLTKEEIQKFAVKTQEIRGKRQTECFLCYTVNTSF